MADENTQVQEGQEPTQVEYTQAEQLAMEKGWKPREDYDGDPANFRSAELFLQLEPLYKKIDSVSRENKQLKEATQYLTKIQKETKAFEYDRALKALRAERRAAMEEGDFNKADLLEDQAETIKEQKRIVEETPEAPKGEQNALFNEWQERNSWYQKDEDLRDWADGRGLRLHNQGKSPAEVLEILETEVRKKYKEKFTNPNRERASAVEGSQGGSSATVKKEKYVLNDMEKKVCATLIRAGAIKDEAEYIESLKQAK